MRTASSHACASSSPKQLLVGSLLLLSYKAGTPCGVKQHGVTHKVPQQSKVLGLLSCCQGMTSLQGAPGCHVPSALFKTPHLDVAGPAGCRMVKLLVPWLLALVAQLQLAASGGYLQASH